MLGTAGHVDHGKTALVKLLTGCETDTLAEEKQRGLTIDLGFAPCRLSDQRVVGVVDVPGHVDFIRNMVAGAQGIDVVILVVAADDGVMPQTREHLQILTLMGLRHGLVALTKIDLVDPARRDQVSADLRRLLHGTFLAEAPICPVSNITGEGYDGFYDALNATVNACDDRSCSGVFRLWIEDVFPIKGAGTVITGIPSSGAVRVADELRLLPKGAPGRVRRMQVYGAESGEARAGECVALNVPEIDHADVKRGMVLADDSGLPAVQFAEAELLVLDLVRDGLDDLLEVHLHIGTAAVLAKVALLESNHIEPGQRQMIQLRMEEPLPLMCGERFVLRGNVAQGGIVTIGGGRILGLSNTRLRRQKPWTLEALAARNAALDDPAAWCELMIREAGGSVAEGNLPPLCRLKPPDLAALVKSLIQQGRILRLPDERLIHAGIVQEAASGLLEQLKNFHTSQPQRAGIAKPDWFARSGQKPAIAEAALSLLLESRKVESAGEFFALPGHSARVSNPDQVLCDQLAATFKEHGFAPPDPANLSATLKQPLPRIQKLTQLLLEQGKLVRVDPSIVIHRDALEAAKAQALRLFAARSKFTTMEFRDALGVSRKYAVPLLDLLDKLRFTVRNGHDRTPGVEARKGLGGKSE